MKSNIYNFYLLPGHTKDTWDNLEVHGCRELPYPNYESIEQVDDKEAEFYSVYYHSTEGGIVAIADFPTREQAQEFVDLTFALIKTYKPKPKKPKNETPIPPVNDSPPK